jgi:RND family efflux transporter MFP subunit
MIGVILAAWMGLLALLVRLNILKGWAMWMKISPAVIFVLLAFLIFVPMNFDAPAGKAVMMHHAVQITPGVSGFVTNVPIESGVPLKKGDLLFEINPLVYQAQVDRLEAQLIKAEQDDERQKKLAESNATSVDAQEKAVANLKVVEAELVIARWDLQNTKVVAPFDGFVTNMMLQPGARVTENVEVMSFVGTSQHRIIAEIDQIHLRNIAPGQAAELIFKIFPGQVFTGKVFKKHSAGSAGMMAPSGAMPESLDTESRPLFVVINLDSDAIQIPPGAAATVAIYSQPDGTSALFRKIFLRMENWMNYIVAD